MGLSMKKSKRIYLYISSYFPRPDSPSSCTFVYNQAAAVKRARPDYDVVLVNPDVSCDYDYKGINVFGFKQFSSGRWLCPWLIDMINLFRFSSALNRAGIRPEDVEVVHGHLIGAAVYVNWLKKKFNSIKAILQFHDADPYGMLFGNGLRGLKKCIYFAYHRSRLKRIDLFVAISENVAKVLREAPHQTVFDSYAPMQSAMRILRFFRPFPCPPIYVLHNGVDTAMFCRSQECIVDRSYFTIGCVGVFRDLKDQMSLLRAAVILKTEIPKLRLLFVRDGVTRNACMDFAESHGLHACFLDEMLQRELPDFYRSLDLFVLPSYFEGLGCVFLEAHACGTPFITCEGQGIEDYIFPEDRSLWLCRQQDPEDLASKILQYYKNRPRQRLRGETDIDKLVPAFLDEVEKLETKPW